MVLKVITEDKGNLRPAGLIHTLREGRFVIGPDLAKRIVSEAAFVGQRQPRTHHVALLADAMRRRQFTPGSQIAFARIGSDPKLHLVNGQHRMLAVAASGAEVEFQVLIEPVDTTAAAQELYYHFDVAQSPRSLMEILTSAGIPGKHGLSKMMAKATYEAVSLICNGLRTPSYQVDPIKARSVDARLDAARTWWPVAAEYEKLIESAPTSFKRKLLGQGVTAVALLTLQYRPPVAAEFWHGIAENDGLRKSDPRHTLIRDLSTRNLLSGWKNQGAAVAAIAWNAYFDRRSLSVIKIYPDHQIRVAGTPFDGKRAK